MNQHHPGHTSSATIPRSGPAAAIGTMHGKEAILGPILGQLGLRCIVPEGLDTDRFGTFTGEVERTDGQLETARRKAIAAAELAGTRIGIASEGSFTPHPDAPWVTANLEMVVLVDLDHDLEIVGRSLTTAVVMHQATVSSADEALAWAHRCGFPDHGVVVRESTGDRPVAGKGITDPETLRQVVEEVLARSGAGEVQLETDLRAHVNRTRRANIARAGRDLVNTARRRCPACERPGFATDHLRPGLPCAACGRPTDGVLAEVRRCAGCDHQELVRAPCAADPATCTTCNP